MIQQDRLIQEFISLVQVDSETRFEQDICVVLKEKFSALGLNVVEDDSMAKSGHGAGNLICTLGSNGQRSCDSDDFLYFPYGYCGTR